jgi:hypothetical protein
MQCFKTAAWYKKRNLDSSKTTFTFLARVAPISESVIGGMEVETFVRLRKANRTYAG